MTNNQYKLTHAIRNNVEWCKFVWQSHGLIIHEDEDYAYCEGPAPQYYPNLIIKTLSGAKNTECLKSITEAEALPFYSIKDCFGNALLQDLGFSLLFDATWFYLTNSSSSLSTSRAGWRKISSHEDLSRWVNSWDANTKSPFRDTILNSQDVEIWGEVNQNAITTGFIINDTVETLGLSNWFGDLKSCMDQLNVLKNKRDVVCYTDSSDSIHLEKAGFEQVGDLRIWTIEKG